MISAALTTAIKAKLDLVQYIEQFVPLRRAGTAYKAHCPFHNERSPSFFVFPERGAWKCFGCKAEGDLFSFVMQREGLTFPQAAEHLATIAGVDLAAEQDDAARAHDATRAALYHLNAAAAAWWVRQWRVNPAAQEPRRYIEQERGFAADLLDSEGFGYAPDGDGLTRHLRDAGHTQESLIAAGLTRADGSDFFRQRLIIPIRDTPTRIAAFAGRALVGQSSKYLNSPQTAVFDKGATLYGLPWARGAIKRAGRVFLVEGYLDALMARQHGHENVVALIGTAFTAAHARTLRKFDVEIILALDPDEAGALATTKALITLAAEEVSRGRVLTLPGGLDLDEWLIADPGGFAGAPTLDGMEWRIRRALQAIDLQSTDGKLAARRALVPLLAGMRDPAAQAIYLGRVATILDVTPRDLRATMARAAPRPIAVAASPTGDDARPSDEMVAVGAALRMPGVAFPLRERIDVAAFAESAHGAVWAELRAAQTPWPVGGMIGGALAQIAAEARAAAEDALPTDPALRGNAARRWLVGVQMRYLDQALRDAALALHEGAVDRDAITALIAARAALARG